MAPHEFVEIRLVCKADYLDPQLKSKLHEIRDKLREILHTGMTARSLLRLCRIIDTRCLCRSKKIRSQKSAAVEQRQSHIGHSEGGS